MTVDEVVEPKKRRGTVLLLSTIIIIASIVGLFAAPQTFSQPNLSVRVAIIDSGVNINQELQTRVVAGRSFVNTSLGYSETDNSTTDSNPRGVSHGSFIASIIASEDPDAALVNAKVVSSNDIATPAAIVAAIRWAVLEENCSVINLSLGISPILNDSIGEAVKWAFNKGVCIVAAAGNNGQAGITGSSVESPAIYPEVIAVAAVDESNELYSFSATGPLLNRMMKPDIAARGYYQENGLTVLGTSFAAPVAAAGASKIISHCITNGWKWTPGLIKSAIMIGADNLPYEEWQAGAGLINIKMALLYIDFVQKRSGLPLLSVISPTISPLSFERYFINHTQRIPVSIFTSGNTTFSISYQGIASKWLSGPTSVFVNQTGSFEVSLRVEANDNVEDQTATILVRSSGFLQQELNIEIDAREALAKVAFDFTHTTWFIDSIYGQFRKLYRALSYAGVAIDELRDPENLSLNVLSQFDAVYVFDPCTWTYVDNGFSYERESPYSYTIQQLAAYKNYFANGGNLFLVGMPNSSIDHSRANALFSQFNITLHDYNIPALTIRVNGVSSTELIIDMIEHPVTTGIDSFDYNGCSLNFTGSSYEIAWKNVSWQDENGTAYSTRYAVLVGLENSNGGRLLASGSNFFFDNWALTNLYRSDQDLIFVLQASYWLLRMLES